MIFFQFINNLNIKIDYMNIVLLFNLNVYLRNK